MNHIKAIVSILLLLYSSLNLKAQATRFNNYEVEAVSVSMSKVKIMGKEALRAVKNASVKEIDEPTFILVKGADFKNGIIEVKVLSRLLPDAPDTARGFIGIAFRINDTNSKFENIYIRPTNGRAENQLRRNRSIQYFSYPDYKFYRTRKETPGLYESYADMGLDEWIKLKITVNENKAQLFINDARYPSLIVNDLKHGSDVSGNIGLWVDIGTEGYFTDLKIIKQD